YPTLFRSVELHRGTAAEIELTAEEQDRVTPLLDGEPAPVHALEQFVGGVPFNRMGAHARALSVGCREGNLADEPFDRPAFLHEARGEVIEQLGIRRWLATVPEVAGGADQRAAKK